MDIKIKLFIVITTCILGTSVGYLCKRKTIKYKIRQNSKCPWNNDINCIAGAFCDGCEHEFDDINKESGD